MQTLLEFVIQCILDSNLKIKQQTIQCRLHPDLNLLEFSVKLENTDEHRLADMNHHIPQRKTTITWFRDIETNQIILCFGFDTKHELVEQLCTREKIYAQLQYQTFAFDYEYKS